MCDVTFRKSDVLLHTVGTFILLYYGAVQQDELKSLLQNGVSATVEVL